MKASLRALLHLVERVPRCRERRPAGETARVATSTEVSDLRREARALKKFVAEQALELRLGKKSMIADGAKRLGSCARKKGSDEIRIFQVSEYPCFFNALLLLEACGLHIE